MTGKNKNRIKSSWRSKLFSLINGIVLTLLALLCILPLVNVLAISLSSNTAVTAGKVMFLPVDFTLKSYEYVAKREAFWRAMGITLERCLLGVALNVLLCIMTAYPLSKKNSRFHSRTAYTWFFFLTMLINGGLIPNFMTVKSLNLLGTIWALVLPEQVQSLALYLCLISLGRFQMSWRKLQLSMVRINGRSYENLCATVKSINCNNFSICACVSLECMV